MRIMITGFEAFGGSAINPSAELLRELKEITNHPIELLTLILPVDTEKAPAILLENIHWEKPDGVVCLGEAAGRAAISLERVAINLLVFRIPDNQGIQKEDEEIVPHAPAAYFSTLPVRETCRALIANGIPAELSLTAGSYLCNQVYYRLMHWLEVTRLHIPAGFIHLPSLPEQMAVRDKIGPSMSIDVMRKAIGVVLDTLFQHIRSLSPENAPER